MPEGPEIWILSEAINKYYHFEKTRSYGKHLFIIEDKLNWSFGLTGKVCINDDNHLIKIHSGWLYGDQQQFEDHSKDFGIDWLTGSETDIKTEISTWVKSKKKLAGLLLDQTKICGIGVAWGSEILFKAGLRPELKACDQNLSKLPEIILSVRENIKQQYSILLTEENSKQFVNEWFDNLYKIRKMNIYKKGAKIDVLGRSWWV